MADRSKKGKGQKNFRKATKEEKAYTKRAIKDIRGKTTKPAATKLERKKQQAQDLSAGPHVSTSGRETFKSARDTSEGESIREGRSLSQGKVSSRTEKKNVDYLQNTRKGQKLQRVEARHMRKDVRKGSENPTQGRHQTSENVGGGRLRGDSPTMHSNNDSSYNSKPFKNKNIDRLNRNKGMA